MKGSYQRYVERELNRARTANENQMLRYQETLKKVADAVGTTVPFKSAPEGVEQQIRPNTVYAVRCSDREEYYRTVYLKPNPFTSNLDLLISNPVYGDPTPEMPLVSPEAVLKRKRDTNLQSLNAFPFNRDGGKF